MREDSPGVTERFPSPARTPPWLAAVVGLAIAAFFAYRISGAVADPDLYHLMALAREALRAEAVPRADVFAFTPTRPVVVDHEWGAALVAYLAATALGGPGILALRYAFAAGIAALSIRTARRAGADGAALAIAALVAIRLVEYGFSPARPQLYTFTGVAFTLACLERDRAGDRGWMAAHALGLLLWANLHGGFVVSFLLLGAYAVEAALARRPFRHVLLLATLESPVVIANPWSFDYPRYLARAIAMPRPIIPEWLPLLSPSAPPAHVLAFGVAVLLVAYGLWRARPRVTGGLPVVALTAFMALRSHRFLPIFGIAWMATVPPLLARTPLAELARSFARRAPRALAGTAGALALLLIFLVARERPWSLLVPNGPPSLSVGALTYPVGAARFLRASGFRGRLMTTFETGGYVSWKLFPDVLVSLDGRYEVAYPDRVVSDVMAFYDGSRPPEEILARYGPDAVLLPRASDRLRARIGWPVSYDDGAFAVLLRPGLELASVAGPVSTEDSFP
jgi:hypothetical protein